MSDFDYDVIVCGVGTAGQTAAIFAAKRGARVLAIDIADEIGGNTARSTGQMSAAGTKLQAERGIHDTPDMHYDDVMRISHGTADPQIVRAAVDNAADRSTSKRTFGCGGSPWLRQTIVTSWSRSARRCPPCPVRPSTDRR